jgi:hypothetical protein
MLIRGVIDDQLGDNAQVSSMRLAHEVPEILACTVGGRDVVIVGHVVAVVSHRRGIKRQQPNRVDAQIAYVVELFGETQKVSDAVVVRVVKGFDVQLVDDRVLVPERVRGPGNDALARWRGGLRVH